MNTIDTTLADNITAAHNAINAAVSEIVDRTSEALLDHACDGVEITREMVVAQIIMEEMFPHPCDPELAGDGDRDSTNTMTTEQKRFLVGVASHMGPDWAQALYRAAVFITKVA